MKHVAHGYEEIQHTESGVVCRGPFHRSGARLPRAWTRSAWQTITSQVRCCRLSASVRGAVRLTCSTHSLKGAAAGLSEPSGADSSLSGALLSSESCDAACMRLAVHPPLRATVCDRNRSRKGLALLTSEPGCDALVDAHWLLDSEHCFLFRRDPQCAGNNGANRGSV